jgi:RND family efflux transporter MFP subunit
MTPSPALSLLFLATLLPSCSHSSNKQVQGKEKNTAKKKVEKLRLVQVQKLLPEAVEEKLPCTGLVESYRMADIRSLVTGQVLEVPVTEGARVKKSAILAHFDDRQAKLNVEASKIKEKEAKDQEREAVLSVQEAERRVKQAVLDFEQAGRELERVRQGVKEGVRSRKDLEDTLLAHDKAKSDLALAKAALEKALIGLEKAKTSVESAKVATQLEKRKLEDYTIRAPFAGTISKLDIKGGEWVPAQTVVGKILDEDHLITYISRPQHELSLIQLGMSVLFEFDHFQGENITGKIEWISPDVDTTTGNFRARVSLRDPKKQVRSGMFYRAWIMTGRANQALLIPKEAIVWDGDRGFAFIAREGKAKRIKIEMGIEASDKVQARNVQKIPGLGNFAFGDLLIIAGQKGLHDGQAIRIKEKTKKNSKAAANASQNKGN